MRISTRAKSLGQKLTLISAAFVLAVSTLTASVPFILAQQASAIGGAINIHTVADLRNAVENQDDGQTWNIYPGSYGLSSFDAYHVTGHGLASANETGWYFPITADDITVNGIGNPTIYGTGFKQNGSFPTQNFLTIFGDDVTIKNLTLMPKIEPNKTIEVLGNNSTIEGVTVTPNTKTNASEFDQPMTTSGVENKQGAIDWGGSIYYNNVSGTHTLSNVTIKNGGIRQSAPSAVLNMTNVNLIYKTNLSWINSYRVGGSAMSVPGAINGVPNYTYQVSHALNNLDGALNAVQAPGKLVGNEKIQLISDLYINQQVNITKPNITIDGKKAASGVYTMIGNFDKTSNSNNSILSVKADGVRVNQLNIDGRNHQLHGINAYEAQDLQLWRVAVKNNAFSGLNVNRSWVQGVDLTTENNGWHGVNVDQPGAFFQSAGINHHTETLYHKSKPVAAIYVDDVTVGTVNDTNDQYVSVDNYLKSGDRAYFLKAEVQPVKDLKIKYQRDSSYLADGATVNKTAKASNNNLVLDFSKPVSTFAVKNYITIETRPDGTSETVWNGANNTWLTAGKNAVGVNDSRAEFGYHGNGEYTYTVTVYYKNGTSATSETISLWFDNQDPVVKSLKVMQGGSDISGGSTNDTLITVKWETDDTDIDYFMYKNKAGWHNVGLDTSFTGNMSGADGVFTYEVYAVDKAGNVSATKTVSVTLDRVAPVAPVMRASSNGTLLTSGDATNQNDVRAEWDAVADGVLYQYRYWNNIAGDSYEGEANAWVKPASIALFHAGTFTQGEGTHFLQVRTSDDAGNWSDWSNAFEVTYDTTGIAVAADTFARSGNVITPNVTTGGETPVSQTWTQLGTIGGVLVSDPTALAPTFTVTQDGSYAYQLEVVDAAGNISTGIFSFSYTTPEVALADADTDGDGDGDADGAVADGFINPVFNPTAPGVEGASDEADEAGVDGASTENKVAQAVNNTDGNAFGLAWYWWLLIAAGAATGIWWLIAALRRRGEEA